MLRFIIFKNIFFSSKSIFPDYPVLNKQETLTSKKLSPIPEKYRIVITNTAYDRDRGLIGIPILLRDTDHNSDLYKQPFHRYLRP